MNQVGFKGKERNEWCEGGGWEYDREFGASKGGMTSKMADLDGCQNYKPWISKVD